MKIQQKRHIKMKPVFLNTLWISVFVLTIMSCPSKLYAKTNDGLKSSTIDVNGLSRKFYIFQPPYMESKKAFPLVIVFHGGGGRASKMARFSGFTTLAEKHGFIAVFPQGEKGHWYDERMLTAMSKPDGRIDDVEFVLHILESLEKNFSIDKDKIFAVGISNGGIFTQQLAVKASTRFRAIATLTAQLPANLNFNPASPVAVLMINGTDDPLMPYSGGDVVVTLSPRKRRNGQIKTRGRVLSTDKTIKLWLRNNDLLSVQPLETVIDKDPEDGLSIRKTIWQGAGNSSRVELYKVLGGGHTWPGRKSFLPEKILGKVSQDIDASEIIWEFFSSLE
ncbi:MAG: prolyl oligopeptidase family serine peptidase [Gammaproteobacteria bacterium]|nr:prolyl oligopeptidase family serine peptidase [Gammaproteobacteria bacterium]